MNGEEPADAQERLALAGTLLAQTGRPRGQPPADEELRLWATHRLRGQRRAEVESHVAHDPAVFQHAMALLRPAGGHAQRVLPPAPRRHWRLPAALAAAIAAAAVAGLLAVTVPTTPPAEGPVQRGAATAAADWRVAAFRSGLADRDPVQPAPDTSCFVGEDCGQLAARLNDLGRLVAIAARECRADDAMSSAVGTELADAAAGLAASVEMAPWADALRAAARAEGQQRCGATLSLRALLAGE